MASAAEFSTERKVLRNACEAIGGKLRWRSALLDSIDDGGAGLVPTAAFERGIREQLLVTEGELGEERLLLCAARHLVPAAVLAPDAPPCVDVRSFVRFLESADLQGSRSPFQSRHAAAGGRPAPSPASRRDRSHSRSRWSTPRPKSSVGVHAAVAAGDAAAALAALGSPDHITAHEREVLRSKLLAASYNVGGQDFLKLFKRLDTDGDGTVDAHELKTTLRAVLHLSASQVPDYHLGALMEELDANGDGVVTADELMGFLDSNAPPASRSAYETPGPASPAGDSGDGAGDGGTAAASGPEDDEAHNPEIQLAAPSLAEATAGFDEFLCGGSRAAPGDSAAKARQRRRRCSTSYDRRVQARWKQKASDAEEALQYVAEANRDGAGAGPKFLEQLDALCAYLDADGDSLVTPYELDLAWDRLNRRGAGGDAAVRETAKKLVKVLRHDDHHGGKRTGVTSTTPGSPMSPAPGGGGGGESVAALVQAWWHTLPHVAAPRLTVKAAADGTAPLPGRVAAAAFRHAVRGLVDMHVAFKDSITDAALTAFITRVDAEAAAELTLNGLLHVIRRATAADAAAERVSKRCGVLLARVRRALTQSATRASEFWRALPASATAPPPPKPSEAKAAKRDHLQHLDMGGNNVRIEVHRLQDDAPVDVAALRKALVHAARLSKALEAEAAADLGDNGDDVRQLAVAASASPGGSARCGSTLRGQNDVVRRRASLMTLSATTGQPRTPKARAASAAPHSAVGMSGGRGPHKVDVSHGSGDIIDALVRYLDADGDALVLPEDCELALQALLKGGAAGEDEAGRALLKRLLFLVEASGLRISEWFEGCCRHDRPGLAAVGSVRASLAAMSQACGHTGAAEVNEAEALKRANLEAHIERGRVASVRSKLTAASYVAGGADVAALFSQLDRDASGALDFDEFRTAVRVVLRLPEERVSDKDVDVLFDLLDKDGDETVDMDEFTLFVRPAPAAKKNAAAGSQPGGVAARLGYTARELTTLVRFLDPGADGEVSAADFEYALERAAIPPPRVAMAVKFQPILKDIAHYCNLKKISTFDFFHGVSGALRGEGMHTADLVRDLRSAVSYVESNGELARQRRIREELQPTSPTARDREAEEEAVRAARRERAGKRADVLARLRLRFKTSAYSLGGKDWRTLFGKFDVDHNGELDLEELRRAVRHSLRLSKKEVPDSTVDVLFHTIDADRSGQVSMEELVRWVEHRPGDGGDGDGGDDDAGGDEAARPLMSPTKSMRRGGVHAWNPTRSYDQPWAENMKPAATPQAAADADADADAAATPLAFALGDHRHGDGPGAQKALFSDKKLDQLDPEELVAELANRFERWSEGVLTSSHDKTDRTQASVAAAAELRGRLASGLTDAARGREAHAQLRGRVAQLEEHLTALGVPVPPREAPPTPDQQQPPAAALLARPTPGGGGGGSPGSPRAGLRRNRASRSPTPPRVSTGGGGARRLGGGAEDGGLASPNSALAFFTRRKPGTVGGDATPVGVGRSLVTPRKTQLTHEHAERWRRRQEWERQGGEKMRLEIRSKLQAASYRDKNGSNYHTLFAQFDSSGNGDLDRAEFLSAVRRVLKVPKLTLCDRAVGGLFDVIDADRSGEVDIDEIIAYFKPAPVATRKKVAVRVGEKPDPLTAAQLHKVRSKMKAAAYTSGGRDWGKLFGHVDRDRSGCLDFAELKQGVRRCLRLSPEEMPESLVRAFFSMADADGGGSVDVVEIVALIEGVDHEAAAKLLERQAAHRAWEKKKAVRHLKAAAANPTSTATAKRASWRMSVCHAVLSDAEAAKLCRSKFKAAAYASGGRNWKAFIRGMDKDGDGHLGVGEFTAAIRRVLKISSRELGHAEIESVFRQIDADDSGHVGLDELVDWVEASPEQVGIVRERLRQASIMYTGPGDWYSGFDADGSGELDRVEFERGVRVVLGIAQRDIDHTALKHIFAAIDDDSSGLMSMEELVDFVEGGGAEEETGGDGEGDSPVNGVLTGGRDRSKSPVAGARSKSPVAGEKSGSSPILWEKVVRVPVSGTKGGAQAPAPELLSPTP